MKLKSLLLLTSTILFKAVRSDPASCRAAGNCVGKCCHNGVGDWTCYSLPCPSGTTLLGPSCVVTKPALQTDHQVNGVASDTHTNASAGYVTTYTHAAATVSGAGCTIAHEAYYTDSSMPAMSTTSAPIKYDPATRTFDFSGALKSHAGNYNFRLRAKSTVGGKTTSSNFSETMNLVVHKCLIPVIGNQADYRISQGDTKEVAMVTPLNCPITYTCVGCSSGTSATSTLPAHTQAPVNLTVAATLVNKLVVNAVNWQTTQSFTARMTSPTPIDATSQIKITVVPCEITQTSITIAEIETAQTGPVQSPAHSVYTYADSISTLAACGPIIYELVGGDTPLLTYDTSQRKISVFPQTPTFTGTIRAKSSNFPLNFKDTSFKVKSSLCLITSLQSGLNPPPKQVTIKVYNSKDWNVLTLDAIMDSKSIVQIKSWNRPAPPTAPLFCGGVTITSKVMDWKPFYMQPGGVVYEPGEQRSATVPTPSPLTTEFVEDTNQLKINLKRSSRRYGEVGIYSFELKAQLTEYPAITATWSMLIHVLHPCKNIIKLKYPYWQRDSSYKIWKQSYAGVFYTIGRKARRGRWALLGSKWKPLTYAKYLLNFNELVRYKHYKSLLGLTVKKASESICGKRKVYLQLCNRKQKNRRDIEKLVRFRTSRSKRTFFGRRGKYFRIRPTKKSQIGIHEFCWRYKYYGLRGRDRYGLRMFTYKFTIIIGVFDEKRKEKKKKRFATPMVWSDQQFAKLKDKEVLTFYDTERFRLKAKTSKKAKIKRIIVKTTSPDIDRIISKYTQMGPRKLNISVRLTMSGMFCAKYSKETLARWRGQGKKYCSGDRYYDMRKLDGQSITYKFTAVRNKDGKKEEIEKTITLKFMRRKKKKKSKAELMKALEPVYCSGNYNSTIDLDQYVDSKNLTSSQWRATDAGQFYFDCDKSNMDYKLDPVKLEAGKYPEAETKLAGPNIMICCTAKAKYEMKLGTPKVRTGVSTSEAVVTITFDQPMLFSPEWVQLINESKETNTPGLVVTDLNGFKGTADFYRNRLVSWKILSAETYNMDLELTFEDPLWVSQNVLPCFVTLKFGDGKQFKGARFGQPLTPGTEKRIQLEKQLPKETAKALKSVSSVISGITIALALALPFLSAGLGQLKHMIEGLQVIVYYPLMSVMAPSNLGVIQKVIMLIVTFEIIPAHLYQEYIWDFTGDEYILPNLHAVGLDTNIFMTSFGLPYYLFVLACVVLLISVSWKGLVKAKVPYKFRKTKRSQKPAVEAEGGQIELDEEKKPVAEAKKTSCDNLRDGLMWNVFIIFFYEASLEISLSLVIGFRYTWRLGESYEIEPNDPNATTRSFHEASCYIFLVLQVASFVGVVAIMVQKPATLQKIQPKAGALYEGLRVETEWSARFYPVWFMAKRIIFVIVVFNFTYTQGMVLTLLHIYLVEIILVLSQFPFTSSYHTKLEIFNLATAYSFLTIIQIFNQQHSDDFTEKDRVALTMEEKAYEDSELFFSPAQKQLFGWFTVYLLVFYIIIHMSLFAIAMVLHCRQKCKARCSSKKKAKTPVVVEKDKADEVESSENEVAKAEQGPNQTEVSVIQDKTGFELAQLSEIQEQPVSEEEKESEMVKQSVRSKAVDEMDQGDMLEYFATNTIRNAELEAHFDRPAVNFLDTQSLPVVHEVDQELVEIGEYLQKQKLATRPARKSYNKVQNDVDLNQDQPKLTGSQAKKQII